MEKCDEFVIELQEKDKHIVVNGHRQDRAW